jgi:ATP/maltotriose-dependent transcriptional regulator MalT
LLERFVSQIPEEKFSDHPEILLHKAEINRLHGKTDETLNILQKASRIFEEKGDVRGKAEALHLMASVIRRQGRIETAL